MALIAGAVACLAAFAAAGTRPPVLAIVISVCVVLVGIAVRPQHLRHWGTRLLAWRGIDPGPLLRGRQLIVAVIFIFPAGSNRPRHLAAAAVAVERGDSGNRLVDRRLCLQLDGRLPGAAATRRSRPPRSDVRRPDRRIGRGRPRDRALTCPPAHCDDRGVRGDRACRAALRDQKAVRSVAGRPGRFASGEAPSNRLWPQTVTWRRGARGGRSASKLVGPGAPVDHLDVGSLSSPAASTSGRRRASGRPGACAPRQLEPSAARGSSARPIRASTTSALEEVVVPERRRVQVDERILDRLAGRKRPQEPMVEEELGSALGSILRGCFPCGEPVLVQAPHRGQRLVHDERRPRVPVAVPAAVRPLPRDEPLREQPDTRIRRRGRAGSRPRARSPPASRSAARARRRLDPGALRLAVSQSSTVSAAARSAGPPAGRRARRARRAASAPRPTSLDVGAEAAVRLLARQQRAHLRALQDSRRLEIGPVRQGGRVSPARRSPGSSEASSQSTALTPA